MGKKLERRCPACGGKGSLLVSNGTELTYYCECDECHLRTLDHKSMAGAVRSWQTGDKNSFFLQERLL